MPDDMFFTKNDRALRKGRRRAKRASIRRRVEFCRVGDEERCFKGLMVNLAAYGALLVSEDSLPAGTLVSMTVVRDEADTTPLTRIRGRVIRLEERKDGYVEMGVEFVRKPAVEKRRKPVVPEQKESPQLPKPKGVHIIDVILGG